MEHKSVRLLARDAMVKSFNPDIEDIDIEVEFYESVNN